MSDCFWTDEVGCYELCPSTYGGQLYAMFTSINYYSPNSLAVAYNSGASSNPYIFGTPERFPGNPDQIVIDRFDFYNDASNGGCSQINGALPPAWFPSELQDTVYTRSVNPVETAPTGLALTAAWGTFANGVSQPAVPSYLIPLSVLAAASGDSNISKASAGVLFFRVAAGGLFYYGQSVANFCY